MLRTVFPAGRVRGIVVGYFLHVKGWRKYTHFFVPLFSSFYFLIITIRRSERKRPRNHTCPSDRQHLFLITARLYIKKKKRALYIFKFLKWKSRLDRISSTRDFGTRAKPSVHVKQIKRRYILSSLPSSSTPQKKYGVGSGSRVVTIGSMTHFEKFFFPSRKSFFFFLSFLLHSTRGLNVYVYNRWEKWWREKEKKKPAPFETKRGVMAFRRRSHFRMDQWDRRFRIESERARKTRRVKPTFWCRNLPPEDFRSVSSAEAS